MPAISQNGVSKTQGSTTMYQISSTSNNNDNNKNNNTDGEYTDQELLNLVNYFEVSRVELKNVRK